ncbi:MAG: class I SAM-dependent methyltransferase [Phycisphaerales bacterium]|nr:MAG: class I SAM-dependent methyltransferase [Phycisphaerales bacterium]
MFAGNESVKTSQPPDEGSVCTFCGGEGGARLYRTKSIFGDEFGLRRCVDCRAVFLVPRPSAAQLEQAYEEGYYGGGRTKFGPWVEKVLGYFRSSRCRKVARLVSRPANILDVGCGSGEFAKCLVERGYRVCGTELPGKAAERAAQIAGLTLKVGPLREGDFGRDYFDAVCMWHVLEHLAEPKKTLDIIGRILKPGGYVFISLPNIGSLQSRLFRGKWLHLDPPRHLFFLGRGDLVAEMGKLGFAPARESHLSIEQNVFGFQQSILNCLCGRRDMLFEALKGNVEYAGDYPRWKIFLQKGFWVATFGLFVGAAVLEAALRMGGTVEFVFRKTGTQGCRRV